MTSRSWFLRAAVLACVASTTARAQSPQLAPQPLVERYVDPSRGVSLAEAIQQALDDEPSLRAARSDVDAARGMRVQAGLRANPTTSFERREEPAGTDNQTMVSVEWPLELFRRGPRVSAAEREVEATQHAAAERARMVAADVRMRYGSAAAAVREVAIADNLAASASQQLDLLRQRVEQGAAPPLDRDLFDVEARRLQSDRLLAVARADRAMYELRRAMGQPADTPLMLRDTLETLVTTEPPTGNAVVAPVAPLASLNIDASVISERPDVREAEARLLVAKAHIERAQSEGRFDLSVFGSYMRMDAGFPQRGFDASGNVARVRSVFNYVAAGAMVTLPLRNRNQGEVAAARAAEAGATATLQGARLAAQAEIAAAATRTAQTREALTLLEGSIRLARQNLDVVRQTYELGRMTVAEVLMEQRRYLDVERSYTDALREAYEAQAALQNARGERP